MTETTSPRGFTRRSFIKGVAAVTAAGALAGCTPKEDDKQQADPTPVASADEIVAGVCRCNCAGACALNVHVRDGIVVRTSARDLPDTQYNRICAKGITHPARVYGSRRLQYPMRRVGERGKGEFERITWDEAIDEIATKWQEYADEFGPQSIAVATGSGNYGVCSGVAGNGEYSAVARLRSILGCSDIKLNVDAAQGLSYGMTVGMTNYGTNNEPRDFINSKTFICWGANPPVSQPQVMHFILEAKDNGTKYVVIDPLYNANAAKADWYIPINATTDGVLAFGVLNVIFENGWTDVEFVRAHTEAPLLIRQDNGMLLRMSDLGVEPSVAEDGSAVDPYAVWDESSGEAVALESAGVPAIEGVTEVNGIAVKTTYDNLRAIAGEWSFEKVEELTGVPEADVRELARIYHEDGPVNTYMMFGNNHYTNAHYNYWPIYAISFLTGNVGKRGGAVGFSELMGELVFNYGAVNDMTDASGNRAQGRGGNILINEVTNVLETGTYAGEPFTLKSCYIASMNPMANTVDHNFIQKWFEQIEFTVVADLCMTETAKWADILLPASHWFEQVDMYASYGTSPYLMWQDKAIEPLYESKPDFDIYKLICERMGYGEFFDLEPEAFIEQLMDSDALRALGATYEGVKETKAANILGGDPFVSFEGGNFATATGRARLYQDTVANSQYDIGQEVDASLEIQPCWIPSSEAAKDSEARKKYPFHVISEHMRTRTHSQWWDVDYLKEYEPEPIVRINPEDAAERGIAEGDEVKLFNDRGYVVMKAVLSNGNPRGTLSAPRSFQAEEFIDGHFASLAPRAFNQICANQTFNDVAVDIEKM